MALPRKTSPRFNPRAREGRDAKAQQQGAAIEAFQSTRPRGARLYEDHIPVAYVLFQSTRPRGARLCDDDCKIREAGGFNPRAREGRDLLRELFRGGVVVSIHAPARGATARERALNLIRIRFNPRAREGRDECSEYVGGVCPGFNPRAREGRDRAFSAFLSLLFMFQSTRPRGARPSGSALCIS